MLQCGPHSAGQPVSAIASADVRTSGSDEGNGMPTKLDNAEVGSALAALPGWIGDADRLQLEIMVDGDESEAITTEVMNAANAMDHHPVIDHGPGTTTFTVWTHSVGGVTELDVALARKITQILHSAGVSY